MLRRSEWSLRRHISSWLDINQQPWSAAPGQFAMGGCTGVAVAASRKAVIMRVVDVGPEHARHFITWQYNFDVYMNVPARCCGLM